MNKDTALGALRKKLETIDELRKLTHEDPEFLTWQNSTKQIIEAVFGPRSQQYNDFQALSFQAMVFIGEGDDTWDAESYSRDLNHAQAQLSGMIENIELFGMKEAR